MILLSLCNSCFQAYEIILGAGDMELMKSLTQGDSTAACPRGCGGRINMAPNDTILAMAGKFKEPLHLTGIELYQALGGMGLPDEVPKDPEVIAALLKANKVVAVSMETVGPRIYLHEITLENGMIIHLSSGARGASVLKVTKPHG